MKIKCLFEDHKRLYYRILSVESGVDGYFNNNLSKILEILSGLKIDRNDYGSVTTYLDIGEERKFDPTRGPDWVANRAIEWFAFKFLNGKPVIEFHQDVEELDENNSMLRLDKAVDINTFTNVDVSPLGEWVGGKGASREIILNNDVDIIDYLKRKME
jgi:hypothetical protein